VGPHTSNWDFIFGVAYRSILSMNKVHFLGKKELFMPPFGFIFRALGGTPVDRHHKHNMVDQVVEIFNKNSSFKLAISPEGTRKKVDKLRTGFYFIAKKANVPIIMVGLDFKKKQVTFSEPFYTSDNREKDFLHILNFFEPIEGKIPTNGLAHLCIQNQKEATTNNLS